MAAGNYFGKQSTECSALDPKVGPRHIKGDAENIKSSCGKYEEKVENNVENAHQHIQYAGYEHIPAAPQHRRREVAAEKHGQRYSENGEIFGTTLHYFRIPTQQ